MLIFSACSSSWNNNKQTAISKLCGVDLAEHLAVQAELLIRQMQTSLALPAPCYFEDIRELDGIDNMYTEAIITSTKTIREQGTHMHLINTVCATLVTFNLIHCVKMKLHPYMFIRYQSARLSEFQELFYFITAHACVLVRDCLQPVRKNCIANGFKLANQSTWYWVRTPIQIHPSWPNLSGRFGSTSDEDIQAVQPSCLVNKGKTDHLSVRSVRRFSFLDTDLTFSWCFHFCHPVSSVWLSTFPRTTFTLSTKKACVCDTDTKTKSCIP